MTSPYQHGGNVESIARRFGIAPSSILDFSSNINPAGLPQYAAERLARESADAHLIAQYPDPEAHELRAVLSEQLQVAPESIVIGPGAAALIMATVQALRPRTCLIPVPAFCEYERACHACGCEVCRLPSAAHDLLVLNNPHNPTGALMSRPEILARIDEAQSAGANVMIDEAFIDYQPQASVTQEAAARRGVVAIRSLTKFYGCPALRVGYAVAEPELARRISAQVPAWPITTLAMNALAEALLDTEYTHDTLCANARNRDWLTASLYALGFTVQPSSANFLLVRMPEGASAVEVRERLIADHAILVRECESFRGLESGRFLRVAVRNAEDNARLMEALLCLQNRR